MKARAAVNLGAVSEEIEILIQSGGLTGTMRLNLSGSLSGMAGLDGSFSAEAGYTDNIRVDDSGAMSNPKFARDGSLNATMYAGGSGNVQATVSVDIDTEWGPVTLNGGGSVGVDVKGSYSAGSGASFDIDYKPKAFASVTLPFGGGGNLLSASGRRETMRDAWQAGALQLNKRAAGATGMVNDIYGGAIKALDQAAISAVAAQAAAEGGVSGAAERLRAEAGGLTQYLGMDVGMLLNRETWNSAQGLIHGVPANMETDALLQELSQRGIGSQILNADVGQKAKEKAEQIFKAKEYVTESVKSAITESAGGAAETVEEIATATLGAVSEARGAVDGVRQMPNAVRSKVMDYGDGAMQSLVEGTTDLSHRYAQQGYYLAQMKVECQSLSVPPQSMLMQVQDLDVAGEKFPTATKAAVAALAQGMGGGIGMGSDAWGTYNGDKVPIGLKVLGGLNPVDWNTSGDGIDDDWALKTGLDPRKANADNDQDGDGLTAWQEYRGEGPDEGGPETQSRRAARRGNGPNQAAANWTHPLKDDTDGGGVADGDELLWGTNPKNASDDKKPCTGCQKVQCTCPRDCECGGCEECMPKDDDENKPVQSCDPNEIVGPLGAGDPETERFVLAGDELEYTIYFENKAEAAAAAQEVWVEMQLDPNVDWSTFKAGSVQAGATWDEGLSGKANWTSEVAMAEG
ncbi:MAG: hypothetical protein J6Y19_06940, partial [Kiritimatiellae bacterium]|nr:hypothetical protein [Kiritimatiellia bacterium]